MSLNLNLLSCPKCGGKLSETSEGKYSCTHCERVWEKEIDNSFEKILGGLEALLQEKEAADIARLKRALYEETHKEFISSAEVLRICKDILEHHDDGDFYARFYLAVSESKRTAFSDFCEEIDIASRKEDVPELLDYLITGLREEWISNVSEIIEKAYKSKDTQTYAKYRDRFEKMAEKVQDGIYEPTLPRDVFVMYSGKDMDKVIKMVSLLENDYGLSCFVAAKNLKHGVGATDVYKKSIHEAIKNCNVYLLISSENSRARQCEVYEEILYIMDKYPKKPRVEYLAEDYKGYGTEKKFKQFFEGLEYCVSYEAAAERIADYCDDIRRESANRADSVKEEPKKIEVQAPSAEQSTSSEVEILLSKAKRLRVLGKNNEAESEYEWIIDNHPNDIRAYIELVALLSGDYKNLNSPNAENHIKVINSVFGEEKAKASDKNYASYIDRIKAAKDEAERKRKEEEERRRKAEEAERKRKEEEEKRLNLLKNRFIREGNTISFGYWPQSKVTDSSLISALNSKAGTLPKYGSNGSWISYKYYIKGKNTTDFMWYQDIEHNGERYRGVYFTSYRPYKTSLESNEENTRQQENGYDTGTVYWFKLEPLNWRILEEKGGKVLIHSDMLIDSREYYDNRNDRTLNGKTIYPNNYEYSNIRKWLNETFLEGAFTATQKGLISKTTVDNSAKTTRYAPNEYACQNTSDSIFFLSYKDAENEGYGFKDASSRLKKTTDYAQSQGAYTSIGGNGYWWLRSPHSVMYDTVCRIYNDGELDGGNINITEECVCPALWLDMREKWVIEQEQKEIESKRKAEEEQKRNEEEAHRRKTKKINEFLESNPYYREKNEIYFGYWPQSKVTDSSLISALKSKAGTLPKDGSNGSWISYKYYIKGKNTTDFMWYQDIEHNGERYRGVYFTSYRPYWTTYESNEENTRQKENGYDTGTVYWFKWEPLNWRILEEKGGNAMILSDMLIDSQEFYHDGTNLRKVSLFKAIHPNNYAESNVRKWLNETFFESAFTATQKGLISKTTVDNSAKTTDGASNKYTCKNTSDSIFLLSYNEATKSGYGFKDDSLRVKKTTDYAQSQGAYTESGNGYWWLRSPYSILSDSVRRVGYGGEVSFSSVNFTYGGVCPALWISL